MRRATQPRCRHGCRFLQITPGLYLCPHASWGFASNLRGAVDEARQLLARAGGYETLLAKLVAEEEERKAERRETLAEKRERLAASVRYD
jgi:hypothetical protein